MAVNKEILLFDPADPDGTDNAGAFIRSKDGELITQTPNGSKRALDVNIVSDPSIVSESIYNEVTSVANSITTTVLTYTVPVATSAKITNVDVSGTNIATYEVLVNAVVIDKKRTYFGGQLNEVFKFDNSISLVAGDVVLVRVTHSRPMTGDFNTRLAIQKQL